MATQKDNPNTQYLPFPPTQVVPAEPAPPSGPEPEPTPEPSKKTPWETYTPAMRAVDLRYVGACLLSIAGLVGGMLLCAHFRAKSSSPYVHLLAGILPFQFFALGAALLMLIPQFREHGFGATLDMSPPNCTLGQQIKATILTVIPLFIGILILNDIAARLCTALGISIQEQMLVTQTYANAKLPFYLVLSLFSTIILAPITEEILFRLTLFRAIRSFAPRWATFATGVAFALMHDGPQFIPSLILLSCVLQYCRRQGGLLRSILVHACYNLVATLVIYLSYRSQ